MRVTVDTDVFVSALNFGGVPQRLFDRLDDGDFVLCISPALIAELRRVLADRFGWNEHVFQELLDPILAMTEMTEPAFVLNAVVDPDDNRILECAVESKSDVIVTGDDHLLRLGMFEGIPIVTPRKFLDSLDRMTRKRRSAGLRATFDRPDNSVAPDSISMRNCEGAESGNFNKPLGSIHVVGCLFLPHL